MKTFVRNGPALPAALMQAHEEGRLVFFCGAGISYYTGLPTFSALVEQAMLGCCLPYDPGEKHHPRDLAFKEGRLDRALHLLELDSLGMRDVVMRILEQPPKPGSEGLDLHKALLTLARTEAGHILLATTNFDDRFERAQLGTTRWQAGPRLGIARSDSWPGPTYLHGKIDRENDPEGKELVLTSGDFGRAYLRDAWAARFIVELFREFTVLFVGYSLNDPIVGYLVDAIAADMGPNRQFRHAYALADFNGTKQDEKRQTDAWKAKGVEPILFQRKRGKNPFGLLDDTLREWARQYAGGLNSRIEEALKLGAKPSVTNAVTQETRNLAWALSKEDGSVARAFANAPEPPDISWLEPLSQVKLTAQSSGLEFGLFDGPSPPGRHHLAPLAGAPATHPPLADVTWELGRWLAKHMEQQDLVNWVIGRGGLLHPRWAYFLENNLPDVKEPWASFWRLLLDGATVPTDTRWFIRMEVRRGRLPSGAEAAILAAATPRLKLNKPFRWGEAASAPPTRLSDLGRFDLELADHDLLHDLLGVADEPPFPALLLDLADPLTSRLADAMRLAQRGGSYIGGMSDRFSLLELDDFRSRTYAALALLCIRTFSAALADRPDLARSLTRRWMDLWRLDRLYLFRRMALHALTHCAAVSPKEEVAFMLDDHGAVLWAYDCEPELGRYLAHRAPHLPAPALERLREATIAGPSAETFPTWSPEDIAALAPDKIFRRLGKLREGGVEVPLSARDRPEDMVDFQPVRVFSQGPDDDHSEDLTDLPPQAAAEALMTSKGRFSASRSLAGICTKKPELALACLPILASSCDGKWPGWGGLSDLASMEHPQTALDAIKQLVAAHPDLVTDIMLWSLAQMLRGWGAEAIKDILFRQDYLVLWQLLWVASSPVADEADAADSLRDAINNAGGILAEALVDLILGLPPEQAADYLPHLTLMSQGRDAAARQGRIIAASRLIWLHRLFPEWACGTIIPRMTHGDPEAESLWEGYFWGGRWDIPLMQDMASAFLSVRGVLQNQQVRESWNDMFADILMEAPSLLPERDVFRVMRNASSEDLRHMAWHFSIRLDAAKDKAGDLWLNAIRPIMERVWPGAVTRHTSDVVETLARMALRCGNQFADAVRLLDRRKLLRPVDREGSILMYLDSPEDDTPDLCIAAPEAVLILLSRTTRTDLDQWAAKKLGAVLKRLTEAQPDFATRQDFQKLQDVVVRAGQ